MFTSQQYIEEVISAIAKSVGKKLVSKAKYVAKYARVMGKRRIKQNPKKAVVAVGMAAGGVSGIAMKKYDGCIGKCDKQYILKNVLSGAVVGTFSPVIVSMFQSQYRAVCVAKCNVDKYTVLGNELEKVKWQKKLRDRLQKAKSKIDTLKSDGKNKEAQFFAAKIGAALRVK
ncbi:MAG: hypothetical protein KAS32_03290 [Candidatus Peribacteraceae bacterium]|nr:hypothetical protein [Candidatus Peribacteraceae bacterium]